MLPAWKIKYYHTAKGNSPIFEIINNLPPKTQAKVAHTFDLLQQYGIQLGFPHVKKLVNTPLWELRILGSNNFRVFYVAYAHQTFLILHAFLKKQQKTPIKEVKTALKRLQDYQNRISRVENIS